MILLMKREKLAHFLKSNQCWLKSALAYAQEWEDSRGGKWDKPIHTFYLPDSLSEFQDELRKEYPEVQGLMLLGDESILV